MGRRAPPRVSPARCMTSAVFLHASATPWVLGIRANDRPHLVRHTLQCLQDVAQRVTVGVGCAICECLKLVLYRPHLVEDTRHRVALPRVGVSIRAHSPPSRGREKTCTCIARTRYSACCMSPQVGYLPGPFACKINKKVYFCRCCMHLRDARMQRGARNYRPRDTPWPPHWKSSTCTPRSSSRT